MGRLHHLFKLLRVTDYLFVFFFTLSLLVIATVFRNTELFLLFLSKASLKELLLYMSSQVAGLLSFYTVLGSVALIGMGILVALNIVLLFKYIKIKRGALRDKKIAATGMGGLVASLLGIGCASCGTAVLLGALSTFGGASIVLSLPLHGEEFSLIGLAALLYTSWYLLGKLDTRMVC